MIFQTLLNIIIIVFTLICGLTLFSDIDLVFRAKS